MASLAYTIRQHTIGDAIKDLLAASSVGTAAKVVQFGFVDRLALVERLSDYLPGIFIQPVSSTPEIIGVGGSMQVDDAFRIAYAISTEDNTLAVWDSIAADLATLSEAIAADTALSALSGSIGNDQIQHTRPVGIEWDPPEEGPLAILGAAVKVVVMGWTTRWLVRP